MGGPEVRSAGMVASEGKREKGVTAAAEAPAFDAGAHLEEKIQVNVLPAASAITASARRS